jgi:hypothetical protein
MSKRAQTFAEFYPGYLAKHQDPRTRRLHMAGSGLAAVAILAYARTRRWPLLVAAPVVGYGLAWIGHLLFEENEPAAFQNPFYSFLADWKMMADTVLARRPPA